MKTQKNLKAPMIVLLILFIFCGRAYSQLNIMYPNGGEVLLAGTDYEILWTPGGTSGFINLEYSPDDGFSWFSIVDNTSDDGSFVYQFAENVSEFYLIRISDTDGEPSDVCDSRFTVIHSVNPGLFEPSVMSNHWGDDQGSESYSLDFRLRVIDPQGLENIAHVTVTSPAEITYELFDNGQNDYMANDGIFGIYISFGNESPLTGEYVFTVTDLDGHTSSISDLLNMVIDFPHNISPVNNSFVTNPTPEFSWDPVSGALSYIVQVIRNNYYVWGTVTNENSVLYNYDGNGSVLSEGSYYWYVIAQTDDAYASQSANFTYSTNPDDPILYDASVTSYHGADETGSEDFGFRLYVSVNDPQGMDDIANVSVRTPDGAFFELSESGWDQHRFYLYQGIPGYPLTGAYEFSVTDQSGNTDIITDTLHQVLDYPRSIQPSDNSILPIENLLFSWSKVENAEYYAFDLTDENNNSIFWRNGLTDTVLYYNDASWPNLEEGKIYRWRVTATANDASSEVYARFIISSDQVSPIIGFKGNYMYRDYSPDNDYIYYYIETEVRDPQGRSDILSYALTTPSGQEINMLDYEYEPGKFNYYSNELPSVGDYRFISTDKTGNADTFIYVMEIIPSFPANTYPSEDEFITAVKPQFKWDAVPGAYSYSINLYDENSSHIWGIDTDQTFYNYDGPELLKGKLYSWVLNLYGDGYSIYHYAQRFYISSDTISPLITYLDYGGSHNGNDLGDESWYMTFSVNVMDPQGLEDIQKVYLITFTGDSIDLIQNEYNLNNFSYYASISEAPGNGKYKLICADINGNSDTSTIDVLVPDYPRNVVPGEGQFVTSATPKFSWDPVEEASSYILLVRDQYYNEIWQREIIDDTCIFYNVDGFGQPLTKGVKYFWRISAISGRFSGTHDDVSFTFLTDTINPLILPNIQVNHYGNDYGYEEYAIDLYASVYDPQGPADIESVKVVFPGGQEYFMDNNGNDSYSYNMYDNETPDLGEYKFYAADNSGNIVDTAIFLNFVLDFPKNCIPSDNSLVPSLTPEFKWKNVDNADVFRVVVRDENYYNLWYYYTNDTAVTYNEDGYASVLEEGKTYFWQVQAFGDKNSSRHEEIQFTISSETSKPLITSNNISQFHAGKDKVYEYYYLDFTATVADPQGLSDIKSVTVTMPGGEIIQLNNSNESGQYYYSRYSDLEPLIGDYMFNVEDNSGNTNSAIWTVSYIIDIPRNLIPEDNSVINNPNPVFQWKAVINASGYSIDVYDENYQNIWYNYVSGDTSAIYDGPALIDGHIYRYQITAYCSEGNSRHYNVSFVYSTDSEVPHIGDSYIYGNHWGNDEGYEKFSLDIGALISDPQGIDNIDSVFFESPDNQEHLLNAENSGWYRLNWEIDEDPSNWELNFTVIDKEQNKVFKSETVPFIIDFPRNVRPYKDEVVTSIPEFRWSPVENSIEYYVEVFEISGNPVWNSNGITDTSVAYGGIPLQDGQMYYWKVTATNYVSYAWQDSIAFTFDIAENSNPPVIRESSIENGQHLVFTFEPLPETTNINAYRDTRALFVPDKSNGTNRVATNITDEDPLTEGIQWTDQDVAGDPTLNYYYIFTSVDGGAESENSETFGVFDYSLITTATTDFNEIALPVNSAGVSNAGQLMDLIPGCNSVAKWNASLQGYDQYVPFIPGTNFSVLPGYPYYVNVTVNNNFTLAGNIANPVFDLITTPTTDFNDIMVPLDKTSLNSASELQADIPYCNSIAIWDASQQGYQQYVSFIPSTNFGVRTGYPYYVNVTANTTWPGQAGLKSTSAAEVLISKNCAPHVACGKIISDIKDYTNISFETFITSNPGEKLNHTSPGCMIKDGYWMVQCHSFPSGWKEGETVAVLIKDNFNNVIGKAEVLLTNEPVDIARDLNLEKSSIFSLHSYPDPFASFTIIHFDIPVQSHVQLDVYSLNGQLLKTLVSESKGPGSYEVQWNGTDSYGNRLSPGIYIYRLDTKEGVLIRKTSIIN